MRHVYGKQLDSGRALWAARLKVSRAEQHAEKARRKSDVERPQADASLAPALPPNPSIFKRFTGGLEGIRQGVHELVRPAYQAPPARQTAGPRYFFAKPTDDLETRLADLEEGARAAMGTAALRGWEWGARFGLMTGGIIALVLALMPTPYVHIPLLSTMVAVGCAVLGALVGGLVQLYARMRVRRQHPQLLEEVLQELLKIQDALMQVEPSKFTGQHLRQMRRVELLQKDLEGGVRHALWQLLHGITNVDPKLRMMFKNYAPT